MFVVKVTVVETVVLRPLLGKVLASENPVKKNNRKTGLKKTKIHFSLVVLHCIYFGVTVT